MLEVQGKLISLDIIEKKFVCDLEACKGACCVEGESGAPLDPDEANWLSEHLTEVLPFLDAEGQEEAIRHTSNFDPNLGYTTPLKKNQACIYSVRSESGILKCGIEQAYMSGNTDFIKPISCHLYPIRISKDPELGWEALNYDRWEICNPACKLGNKLNVAVYRFLKTALTRKYGSEFYEELHDQAHQWQEQNLIKP